MRAARNGRLHVTSPPRPKLLRACWVSSAAQRRTRASRCLRRAVCSAPLIASVRLLQCDSPHRSKDRKEIGGAHTEHAANQFELRRRGERVHGSRRRPSRRQFRRPSSRLVATAQGPPKPKDLIRGAARYERREPCLGPWSAPCCFGHLRDWPRLFVDWSCDFLIYYFSSYQFGLNHVGGVDGDAEFIELRTNDAVTI